ncbi:cytochrome P450 [Fusarium solani]|uniref:Cytochrome P450 n=1 Tax=Fusarium solani TaxID=169388 RepID=A0A9P9H9S2_FUSSL|nr:cytochrome P450 [Fusarium solani]KAH7253311.1 cytochrome P450 [Fusarium solani]
MAIVLSSLAALQSKADSIVVAVAILVALVAVTPLVGRLTSPRGAPRLFRGYAGLNSPTFAKSRNDYLRQGKEQSPDSQFSFWHGPHHMVSVSGEVARNVLLTSRKLNALAGFATLFGSFLKIDSLTNSYARLALLTFKRCAQDEHIESNLPRLIDDSRRFIASLNPSEAWDPVDKLGYLMYQLTHRMVGTHDIANNPELVVSTRDIYKPLDHSSLFEIWFPLLPTLSKLRKAWAYTRLHWLVQGFITDRRKTGRKEKDAMQMMMDQEFKDAVITLAVIGAILAGVLNTSITAAWNVCYLAQSLIWQSKLRAEVDQVIVKYRRSPGEDVAEVLQRLKLKDWETEFPLFEFILKETMRFVMAGQIVRKNISNKGVAVGDTDFIIPQNSFAVYPVEDVHMDPAIYKNPLEWDPSRHDKNVAEGSQSPHSFLAWGSGNHTCPAMRFSKLNILVPTVMLVALYDFEMCNAQGQTSHEPLPRLSYDGIGAGRPTGKVYVKCSPRDDA